MPERLLTLGFALGAVARPHLGRRRMEDYQLRRLRALLRHAERHVPHYRSLFADHGVRAGDIRSLADLRRVPTTGKLAMRVLPPEAMLDERLGGAELFDHRTSGSTGTPTRIRRTPGEERRLNLLRWRALLAQGLRHGDRIAIVATIWDVLPDRFDRLQARAGRLGVLDRRIFDCFQPVPELLSRLRDYRPQVLMGYPGVLAKLARGFAQQGDRGWRPRMVVTGGECLLPWQRELLRNGFGASVFDHFGTSECNLVAWECPVTGEYHVCDDGVIVEICRDGVPVACGEEGEVVITALHSRAMPLIRIPIGDLAIAGHRQCPCGSPFSTLAAIRGRVIDELPLADGRRLHPFEVSNEIVLGAGDWIAEYCFTQHRVDEFRLEFVAMTDVGAADIARLRDALLAVLGSDVRLAIDQVAAIARDPSGKLHFVRSLVRK